MQFSSVINMYMGKSWPLCFYDSHKDSDVPWFRRYNPSPKLPQYSVFINFLFITYSPCLFFYSMWLKWSISRDLSLECHTGRTNTRVYLRRFPLHTLYTAYSNLMHFFFWFLGTESPTLNHSYFLQSQKWLSVHIIWWNLKVCEYKNKFISVQNYVSIFSYFKEKNHCLF